MTWKTWVGIFSVLAVAIVLTSYNIPASFLGYKLYDPTFNVLCLYFCGVIFSLMGIYQLITIPMILKWSKSPEKRAIATRSIEKAGSLHEVIKTGCWMSVLGFVSLNLGAYLHQHIGR